jgi:hypothetical protein
MANQSYEDDATMRPQRNGGAEPPDEGTIIAPRIKPQQTASNEGTIEAARPIDPRAQQGNAPPSGGDGTIVANHANARRGHGRDNHGAYDGATEYMDGSHDDTYNVTLKANRGSFRQQEGTDPPYLSEYEHIRRKKKSSGWLYAAAVVGGLALLGAGGYLARQREPAEAPQAEQPLDVALDAPSAANKPSQRTTASSSSTSQSRPATSAPSQPAQPSPSQPQTDQENRGALVSAASAIRNIGGRAVDAAIKTREQYRTEIAKLEEAVKNGPEKTKEEAKRRLEQIKREYRERFGEPAPADGK